MATLIASMNSLSRSRRDAYVTDPGCFCTTIIMRSFHLAAHRAPPDQDVGFGKLSNTVYWEDLPRWVRPLSFT